MKIERSLVPIERIERLIHVFRGHRIIIDSDLAAIYGVSTKAFNQAVKRNLHRFPGDFMFRLTKHEKNKLVTNCDHLSRLKYSPTLPFAFTEHGAIMAASVLNSPNAIEMSVLVVRAFISFRDLLANHKQLAVKLNDLERHLATHDENIGILFEAIRELMEPPPSKPKRRIGFGSEDTI